MDHSTTHKILYSKSVHNLSGYIAKLSYLLVVKIPQDDAETIKKIQIGTNI